MTPGTWWPSVYKWLAINWMIFTKSVYSGNGWLEITISIHLKLVGFRVPGNTRHSKVRVCILSFVEAAMAFVAKRFVSRVAGGTPEFPSQGENGAEEKNMATLAFFNCKVVWQHGNFWTSLQLVWLENGPTDNRYDIMWSILWFLWYHNFEPQLDIQIR